MREWPLISFQNVQFRNNKKRPAEITGTPSECVTLCILFSRIIMTLEVVGVMLP